MTRILDLDACPHCKVELRKPVPRVCPACGGSLQRRYLAAGCLSSKPLLVSLAVGIAWATARVVELVS